MNFLDVDFDQPVRLSDSDGGPEQFHLFDEPSVTAINSALAARRPLLVRGEPGVGKTQLAAAAAAALHRPLVALTVDSRTESHDLLWHFDSVKRLAEAQLCAIMKDDEAARLRLDEKHFVRPGVLWWGFDWEGAQHHAVEHAGGQPRIVPEGISPDNGRVVLIDEIDKADSDVPNGLLEALGPGRFVPPGCPRVTAKLPPPLVIVTTNEERVLPDAFVRRCLVLHLTVPDDDDEQLIRWLVTRGIAHFGAERAGLLQQAAGQLAADRKRSIAPRPGQAEFLDLVRAVLELSTARNCDPGTLLESVGRFTLRKHSGARP